MTAIQELLPEVRIKISEHATERFLRSFHGPPPNDISKSIIKLVRGSAYFKTGKYNRELFVLRNWKMVLVKDEDQDGVYVEVVSCFGIRTSAQDRRNPRYRDVRARHKREMFIED